MNDRKANLLALHPKDNVLIALGAVATGLASTSDGQQIAVATTVTLGHKIARRDIADGEMILKYGVPIGQATQAIPSGAHVHVHNIKSNYTATHHLQETAGGEN